MKLDFLQIDSQILGRAMLSLQGFDAARHSASDLAAFERAYVAEYKPAYVSVKTALDDLASIHALEKAGFQFMECQIRSTFRPRKPFPAPLPFDLLPVESEAQLNEVLDIAASTFTHDRFLQDSALPFAFSGTRYRAYVLQSWERADEEVFRLVERKTGSIAGFRSHRVLAEGEILWLLGGVKAEYKNSGLGAVNGYLHCNQLLARGAPRITTHISAANYPIFRLEIGRMGFQVDSCLAVLRKVYA